MSTNNADRLDPSVASTTSSREHMPPPPPRLPQESIMHEVNSRGGDFGTSGGQQPSLEEPSVDSTLSALSLDTADTDTILAHWRKQRQNNNVVAADFQGAKEGRNSMQSAFRRLHVTTEEDDDVLNYSDSLSIVQSDGTKNEPANRALLGIKAACVKNEDDLHSANTSPILNGHNRRSAFPSQIRHMNGSNQTIPEGEISLLQSYNSVDEHISLHDFNSVAPNESPYKHIRPQNPQHTHFETDLSIISHSSESISSAFLAGVRAVGDTVPNVHKPLVTPRIADSNGAVRAVRGFDRSPNGQNKSNGQSNGEQLSVEDRDKIIRQLELEVIQWKKGHSDLDSVKQQQSGLVKEIEQLKQNVEQYTCQYNSLCENIELKEEELSSLKADVKFAQTEKEEMQNEYETMRKQISQLTTQLKEERDTLTTIDFEKKEAVKALEKAKEDFDRILKETEVTVSNCKTRELEVIKLAKQADEVSKKLRSDENRLVIDRKKLEVERTTLEKEKKMLSKQQKDSSDKFRELEQELQTKSQNLAEEKKQISLVQDELLLVQSAQSESAAKLKRDEATLEEYSRQMKQQMETLLGREKSCADLEALVESRMENLSTREKLCSKHEEDIAALTNDLTGREQIYSKRKLELEEALKKMTQLEVELSQKVEDIAAKDAALNEREQDAVRAANELEQRKQSCIEKNTALENKANELSSKEVILSEQEHALSTREAECEELENELADAGDALSQREKLCAQQLEDATRKIEEFIDREKAVCKREEEVQAKSKQLAEEEQLLAQKRSKIDLREKSVANRESTCSEQEHQLNKRSINVEANEKSLENKKDELNSQQNVLDKMKQDFQLEKQKTQNELEEENRRLMEAAESQERMKQQLDTQEQTLLSAKKELDNLLTKMEGEQNRLAEKESAVIEAMSEIKERTCLNDKKEKELSRLEEEQLLKSKQLEDAKTQLEKQKSDLELKEIDILAREKALIELAESSKEEKEHLNQKEGSLLNFEQQLQSKEKQLLAKYQAMNSRLADITERENLVEQSADLNSKISQEEKRFNELQSKCEAAADRLQQLQDEAGNLRPVLSEAVSRFEHESKELEDITRRKQMLTREVSILTEKAKTANEEEEKSRNAIAICEKQLQNFNSRMQQEKDSFQKELELKSNEFIASQKHFRKQFDAKTRSAMKHLCQNQAEVFEGASRELSYRCEQIGLMVANLSELRGRFATCIKEKEKLSEQLGESVESQSKCSALLRKAENELLYTQRQCARLQTSLEEQNAQNIELERERSNLRGLKSRLEKEALDLETAKLTCQQELDRIKSSRNIHLEQKAQKLKELMQSITLQNDRLHKKQQNLDEREVSLVARERQLQEQALKNDELYQLVQRQNIELKSLEQDLDDRQTRQITKEQELDKNEERLIALENRLNREQEEVNASRQKMKELALQLQKRNEEMNVQKQQLQDKLRGCDEYEATLSAWEHRLDEAANLMQMQQEDE